MADLCEFSGVNRVGCDHCIDRRTSSQTPPPPRSFPFRARFEGTCSGCGFDIKVGEYVRYVGDGLAHRGCADG